MLLALPDLQEIDIDIDVNIANGCPVFVAAFSVIMPRDNNILF